MQYRRHPYVSFSELKHFMESGFPTFFHKKFSPAYKGKPTTSQEFGIRAHMACLEPDKFEDLFAAYDGKIPTSAQMSSFIDNIIDGYSPVEAYSMSYSAKGKSESAKMKEAEKIMADFEEYISIKKSFIGGDVIMLSTAEKRIFDTIGRNFRNAVQCMSELDTLVEENLYEDPGDYPFGLKGTPDAYCPKSNTLIDIKTTYNIRPEAFAYTVSKYKYLLQGAMYQRLLGKANDESFKFVIVAINNQEPYDMSLFNVGYNELHNAYSQLLIHLEELKQHYNSIFGLATDLQFIEKEEDLAVFYERYADRVVSLTGMYNLSDYSKSTPLTIDDLSNLL